MEFGNKEYLLLLLLLIPYILWYFLYKRKKEPAMRMSDTYAYQYAAKSWRVRLINLPMILRCLAYTMVVIVLARPMNRVVEGIDVMLAMDISVSMLAEDVRPNRLEVAKDVASDFISDRPTDNIGLTIFAGEAFTQCPMTTDHQSLQNILHNVRTDIAANGLIEPGTAIGMGLANAVTRLKDSKTKSKVIILLTDGSNNVGEISPLTAAEIAKSYGIRVYTIGLGTNKASRYPITVNGTTQYVVSQGEIDYKTLQNIALTTNGGFYRATNRKELANIYKDIDTLEKTRFNSQGYAKSFERYQPFALAAFILLLLEVVLRVTVYRRIP
ncbi:MAG: VWA domain-containing protein [Prevotella sp.]|jgi:Ca-activated chloride channel family protein|nr:VWA domain-containing protein [Prevotella sp.]MBQ2060460.1 VWA domain-containing protein [Prevotella sp.]MBQ6423266.1 VWA domain-containing protein [Prevotella sp.]MBR2250511.1 VWA domain-containing protein [Prevotella sp.]MBR7125534.1 VWA domain-containing protein [Prevotella sp.]